MHTSKVSFQTLPISGLKIFYREAGDPKAPVVLLLHGFPTSSHMFRNLIPQLADNYHVIAPDLPGFGFSDAPSHDLFEYTFENVAKVMGDFVERMGWKKFAIYIFDYGAPTGLRIALRFPERISAIITQTPKRLFLPSRLPRRTAVRLKCSMSYGKDSRTSGSIGRLAKYLSPHAQPARTRTG